MITHLEPNWFKGNGSSGTLGLYHPLFPKFPQAYSGLTMTATSSPSPDMSPESLTLSRTQLRREMRQRRRALSVVEQKKAAARLKAQVLALPEFLQAKRIALYLPNDGEIDPTQLIEQARKMGKVCYLPVLQPLVENRLWFVRFDHKTPMTHNRFGIPEPKLKGFADKKRNRCRPEDLDLVLFPLVAFDEQGGRMGMGGGFYDRTFAFTRHRKFAKPAVIGLAHECQKADDLPIADWDIPLQAIASDQGVYRA